MWKLKVAEGGPWLTTTNGHVGRQHWEFDPEAGSPEERAQVEKIRQEFKKNRFQKKQSSDLLLRMQVGLIQAFYSLSQIKELLSNDLCCKTAESSPQPNEKRKSQILKTTLIRAKMFLTKPTQGSFSLARRHCGAACI
ncbi:unnamed protein product [Coffea canephora]|uniref:Squalene cyclase N-terminal domain-containing protein n=1 Tax=Coffea canephora TaxID=49390 RepID=A0A068V0S5_COFCA|nr:unnamed protein product [Coffea canephora]